MSKSTFLAEQQSADPIVRALARKAVRILNDVSLNRHQREQLIRKLQAELLLHDRQRESRAQFSRWLAGVKLPAGCRADMVQIRDGGVEVAVTSPRHGFTWIQLGEAPMGLRHLEAFRLVVSSLRPARGQRVTVQQGSMP